MAEQTQWEYRSITIGTFWTTPKDEVVEAALNELGIDGWEVVSAFTQQNSNQVRIIAKRPLTSETRRRRSYPGT